MEKDRLDCGQEQPRKLSEQYKVEKRVRRCFAKAIRQFGLIEAGDHILIGLSGGKDSLAMLELLGDAMKRSQEPFRVSALHVRVSGVDYRTDTAYLHGMAAAYGIPFYVKTADFLADRNAKRTPCFLCSWHRRKQLFALAQELGCNKIALGHHQDDLLNTALMNLTYSGSFATMPAFLRFRKMPLAVIRPLCLNSEADLRLWAEHRAYKPIEKSCPYERVSVRTSIAAVYDSMAALNPEARQSLWHALQKEGKLVETGEEEPAGME